MTQQNTKNLESAKSIVDLLNKKIKKSDGTPLTFSVDKIAQSINDNTGIVGAVDLFINGSFVDRLVDDNPGGKEVVTIRLRLNAKPRVDKTIYLDVLTDDKSMF